MRALTRIGATVLLFGLGAWGCPLEVRELPGCRLAGVTCDDGNPCTEDRCDIDTGTCVFDIVPRGTDCGDGDACNGLERCTDAGTCESEPPVTIDDANPCTRDMCDPETGIVSHDLIDGCGESFWAPLSTLGAPSARIRHSAIWTGSEMIVWGGRPMPGQVTNSGARYNPETDTWTAMTTSGAPTPRHSHSAVWTGTEMIIWGGFGASDYETTGARYNPVNNTWTPISNTNAPSGRTFQSTLWTGTEMIVWGGLNGTSSRGDGARYAVGNDTWTTLPSPGPSARFKHTAVWTGSQMIVWGGSNTFDWLSNGAVYDRTSDAWVNITSLTDVPQQRERASGVWTGDEMLIWGGWDGGNYLGDGATYDVVGDTWAPINPTGPNPRTDHVWLWTGDQLVVWGGCSDEGCTRLYDDGARYDTDDDSWIFIGPDPGLSARVLATMVWTGTQLIIWGGENDTEFLGDGGRASLP